MLFLPKTLSQNSTCLHITQLYKLSHSTQDLAIESQDISTQSFKFGVEYYMYFCFTQKQWVWVKWASQFYRKNGPGCKHNLCIGNDWIKALEELLGWISWPYFQFCIKTTNVKQWISRIALGKKNITFDISCELLTEKLFLFPSATFARELTEYLRKINIRINDLLQNVLYWRLHGYIQPIVISLVP